MQSVTEIPAQNPGPAEESSQMNNPPKFSQKIESIASAPKFRGAFFTEDAASKNLALVTAKYRDIKVYWLVDPYSDLIYEAKFFSYGGTLSIATGDTLSQLAKGMKVESATSLTIAQLESMLRDTPETPATSAPMEEAFNSLPALLKAVSDSYPAAKAMAFATIQVKATQNPGTRTTTYADLTAADELWLKKSKEEQIAAIDEIIAKDIRPGLNFDGGDLQIVDIVDGAKLSIKYQGACGSCGSSTGATLSYIEDTLRKQIFGGMQVIPVE